MTDFAALEKQLLLHKRLALGGLAGILALIGLFAWNSEHTARVQAVSDAQARQDQIKTLQDQLKDQQKQQADLAKQIKDVQDANARDKAALLATIANLKTPEQHATWDQQQLETLITGIKIAVNPKTGEGTATIPTGEMPLVTEAIAGCQQCKLDLSAAKTTLSFSEQQKQNLDAQLKTQTQVIEQKDKQINDYKIAAKGGTWWHRFKHDVIVVAISGGVGYVLGHKL